MAIYMVTHKQRFHLQEVRNVFYYETVTANPSTSEWDDIVDEIRADYVSELADRMSDQWAFYGINYRIVDTAGLLSFDAVPSLGDIVGTSANDSIATQIALLVSVKGTTVKPNRARTYITGWTEQQVTDSLFVQNARDDAEAFIDFQTVLNSGGTNVLQRVAAQWNTGHTTVVATNNIAARPAVASLVPATQRRRRIGVGI